MKVKVVCNYNTDFNIFKIVGDIWGEYSDVELTYRNDYDVLIIFNKYEPSLIKPNSVVFGFIQEPSWSGFYDKNLPKYCDKVFYHKPEIFEDKNVVFHPSVMLHHLWNKYPKGEIQWKENTTRNVVNSKIEKTKKLSIIVSNRECETQYIQRQNLVKKLLESDVDFDMYGLGWNIVDDRYKGYLLNKSDGLMNYKYSICLENCRENGYISEKFIDAILSDTIPLYYGAPDVDRYYSNCSEYLDIMDDDVIKNIKYIIDYDVDYDIDGAKERYLIDYNPLNIVLNNFT